MAKKESTRPIGMFDSGVGGVSVLRQARKMLPAEQFIFYGDTLHAPYGTKTREEVLQLSRNVAEKLINMDCKAIVIACNTATSAAAQTLRQIYTLPIIAMEPALKPASLLHKDGYILSLATPGTIRGEKYRQLLERYGDGVESLPCPGMMEFVEKGETDSENLHRFLTALFAPYTKKKPETIVLGCTHYVFLKNAIAKHFPGVPLIDGNGGTVRQLKHMLMEKDLLAGENEEGGVTLLSSGDPGAVQLMDKLLNSKE